MDQRAFKVVRRGTFRVRILREARAERTDRRMMLSFMLNSEPISVEFGEGSPVLDLLRMELDSKGTRRGCGEGDCGACTVLLGTRRGPGITYRAVNSCLLPAGELPGRHLVTIEGLNLLQDLSMVQSAIVDQGASQCGFCTPGIVVSLIGYLMGTLSPDPEGAVDAIGGNICRCTGYGSLIRAAKLICEAVPDSPASDPCSIGHLDHLVRCSVLPEWFPGTAEALLEDCVETGADGEPKDALIVAGGTDLMVSSPDEIISRPLTFLSRDPALSEISVLDGVCSIGAAATVSDIMESDAAAGIIGLEAALRLVSSTQVRNLATAGGNIVNASPIGDLSVILIALGAMLSIDGRFGPRKVPIAGFHTGYKVMDLRPGEMIREISFPLPERGEGFSFEKVSMREHLDIASVNSAALFSLVNGRIASASLSAGGVAPVPLMLSRTSELLKGKSPSSGLAVEASRSAMAEVSPIDDVRGTAEYKRTLLGRLVLAHFIRLFPGDVHPGELQL